jgi:hypothetical protein
MQSPRPTLEEWLGLYLSAEASLPSVVFQGKSLPDIMIDGCHTMVALIRVPEAMVPQPQSRTLFPIATKLLDSSISHYGIIHQVRILPCVRGQRKRPVLFFYGKVTDLCFDPSRLKWSDQSSLLDYSTQRGRTLLRK